MNEPTPAGREVTTVDREEPTMPCPQCRRPMHVVMRWWFGPLGTHTVGVAGCDHCLWPAPDPLHEYRSVPVEWC